MLKKSALTLLIICLALNLYAFDWISLHEKGDRVTLEQVKENIDKNPNSLEDLYVLGLVYLNLHKDQEAKEAFGKVAIIQPDSLEAKWGVAECLRRQKKLEESKSILEEIIKKRPDFYPAYITLAYIKYRQTDFNGAVRLALKVMKADPEKVDLSNHTRSYLIYGGAKGMIASRGGPLSKLINGTAVLPNLKKAEKLQPDSAIVLFGLGSFYFLAPRIAGGGLEKAEKYLKRAIEADSLLVDSYVRLAQVYKAKGDSTKYEELIYKASEIDPDNELLMDELGGVCSFNCVTVEE